MRTSLFTLVHNTAHNSSYSLPTYLPHSQHCSNVIYWTEGNNIKWTEQFEKKAASPYGRFSRIRQVASMCSPSSTCFLGLTQVHIANSISIPSAVFAQHTADCSYTLQWAAPFPLKVAPLHWRIWTPHLIHGLLAHPNVNRFSGFCRAHNHEEPTDRPRYSVTTGRIYVHSTVIRPKNHNASWSKTE